MSVTYSIWTTIQMTQFNWRHCSQWTWDLRILITEASVWVNFKMNPVYFGIYFMCFGCTRCIGSQLIHQTCSHNVTSLNPGYASWGCRSYLLFLDTYATKIPVSFKFFLICICPCLFVCLILLWFLFGYIYLFLFVSLSVCFSVWHNLLFWTLSIEISWWSMTFQEPALFVFSKKIRCWTVSKKCQCFLYACHCPIELFVYLFL